MEKHIKIVAAIQIGFSILGFIIGAVIFTVLYIIGGISQEQEAKIVLTIIANILIIFFGIVSIPGIIAGIGLLKRKEWARILTMIISIIDLFNIPIGTAIGGYSLWVLVQPESIEIFRKKSV